MSQDDFERGIEVTSRDCHLVLLYIPSLSLLQLSLRVILLRLNRLPVGLSIADQNETMNSIERKRIAMKSKRRGVK
jgi:hypothetical protein